MSPDEYLADLARWRQDRDRFFSEHYATPLSDEALAGFSGLRYYPADPDFVYSVVMDADEARVEIESSTGATSSYPGAGVVSVPFANGEARMRVLHSEDDDLFIPFRDGTSGVTTYGGGRYVTAERSATGVLRVDFNKATNPYCAYDPDFSCPLPPSQNWLEFPIEAGELDY